MRGRNCRAIVGRELEKTNKRKQMNSSAANATKLSVDAMRSLASEVSYGNARYMKDKEVVAEFGATPEILLELWCLLSDRLTSDSEPKHMLWWLFHCKHYLTKSSLHKALGVSPPTLRKYANPIKIAFYEIRNKVVSIEDVGKKKEFSPKTANEVLSCLLFVVLLLKKIRWKDRLKCDKGRTCKIYHDGVDFKCFNKQNPNENVRPQWRRYPFDPSLFSHKFNASAFRYGISTCIQTGEIVSCHGPFKAGKWPDINIYKKYVKPRLLDGEMVEADAGYHSDLTIRGPSDYYTKSEKSAKKKVASRHETINGRLETFRCLRHQFRHDSHEHKYYFFTAAITTQLMLRKYGTYHVSY